MAVKTPVYNDRASLATTVKHLLSKALMQYSRKAMPLEVVESLLSRTPDGSLKASNILSVVPLLIP